MAHKESTDEFIVVDAKRYNKVKKALEEKLAGGKGSPPSVDEKETTRELVVVDVKRYKRIKKALEASEERFRHLFENVPIGIYRTTPDGRFIDANPALIKMLGFTTFAEVAALDINKEYAKTNNSRSEFMCRLETEGEIKGLETVWPRSDGTEIHVRENSKLVRGENGEVFFEGTLEDITLSRLAEEAQKIRTQQIEILNCIISKGNMAESIGDMLEVILDCMFEPLAFDNAAVFMYDPESNKVKQLAHRGPPTQFALDEKYMSIDNLPFSKVLQRGQPVFLDDAQKNHPDFFTQWGWRMAGCVPLLSKGRVIGALAAASRRREAFTPEEKGILEMIGKEAGTLVSKLLTETALRESEKYYRTLIDTSPDIIVVMDLEARLITVNQQFLKVGNYFYDDVIGKSTYDFVSGLERVFLEKRTSQFIESKKVSGSEYEFKNKDGRAIPLEVSASVLLDDAGQPMGIIAIGRDITERKRDEEQLRFLSSITENITDSITVTDADFAITYINKVGEHLFGYPLAELKGKTPEIFNAEPMAEQIQKELSAIVSSGRTYLRTSLNKRKDGSTFYCEYKVMPLKDSQGTIYAYTSIQRDVSERKRSELAIEEKNKVLAKLNEISLELASMPPAVDINEYIAKKLMDISRAVYVGVNHYNKDTRQLEFARANTASKVLNEVNRILGRNVGSFKFDVSEAMYKEITGEVIGYRNTLHEASFGAISKKAGSLIQRVFNIDHFIGMALVIENELIGTAIMAMGKGTPAVSEELLRSFSHLASVSLRRRQVEFQLAASEDKFKKLFYISPDAILLSRLDDSRIVSVNKSFTKILGYEESDVVGKTYAEIAIFKDPEELRAITASVRAGGVADNSECSFVSRSGESLLGLLSAAILDIHGEKFVISTIRDITQRQQAEEALRQSEEKFRSITEQTGDLIAITDAGGVITYASASARALFQLKPEEMQGRNFTEFLDAPSIPKAMTAFRDDMERSGRSIGLELTMKRKDGSLFAGELNGSSFQYGDQYGSLVVIRDISERKRAEDQLRLSEETFRSTFHAIPDPAYIWKRQADGRITLDNANHAAEKITHGKIKDYFGIEAEKLFVAHPDFVRAIRDSMDTGASLNAELLYPYQSTGEKRWLVVDYVRTALDSVMVITKDVSERKDAEARLLAYQEQLRALTSEMFLIEEKERRRIASELHDQIGQNLALCKLKVAALEKDSTHSQVKSELSTVRRLLECSIQDARSLIFDLSPPVLYELGFQAALEWLAERIEAQYHVPVEFENRAAEGGMGNDLQVILFQVVRELLVNVGKHSRASQAKVILSQEDQFLKIQVNDDGVGFDASQIYDVKGRPGSYGFFSMRERLNYLGGGMDVKSRPGQGSQIVLKVPREVAAKGEKP